MINTNRFSQLQNIKISLLINEKRNSKNIVKEIKNKYKKDNKKIIRYSNRDFYEGKILNNKKNGFGKMIFSNNDIFEGIWKNDYMKTGKYFYNSGETYEGKFIFGNRHGNGKFETEEAIFCGIWKRGEIDNGKIKYKKNEIYDLYEGEIQFYEPNGKGKMIYKNGDIYDGLWKNSEFFGSGKILYKNNNVMTYFQSFDHHTSLSLLSTNNEYYLILLTEHIKISDTLEIPGKISSIKEIKEIEEIEIQISEIKSSLSKEEIDMITCPISLSIMIEPVITSCGHTFCKYSLQKYNEKCAFCRKKIEYYYPNNKINKLYEKCFFDYLEKEVKIEEIRNIIKFMEKYKFIMNNSECENNLDYDNTSDMTDLSDMDFSDTSDF
jgi:hypothetical protein